MTRLHLQKLIECCLTTIGGTGLLWRVSKVPRSGRGRSSSAAQESAIQSRNTPYHSSVDNGMASNAVRPIFLLSALNSHVFLRLMQEYWWAVLLMGVAFVVLMGIFIKCCAVHTPSSNPNKMPALDILQTMRHPYSTLRRKRHHPQQHQQSIPSAPYTAAPNPPGRPPHNRGEYSLRSTKSSSMLCNAAISTWKPWSII